MVAFCPFFPPTPTSTVLPSLSSHVHHKTTISSLLTLFILSHVHLKVLFDIPSWSFTLVVSPMATSKHNWMLLRLVFAFLFLPRSLSGVLGPSYHLHTLASPLQRTPHAHSSPWHLSAPLAYCRCGSRNSTHSTVTTLHVSLSHGLWVDSTHSMVTTLHVLLTLIAQVQKLYGNHTPRSTIPTPGYSTSEKQTPHPSSIIPSQTLLSPHPPHENSPLSPLHPYDLQANRRSISGSFVLLHIFRTPWMEGKSKKGRKKSKEQEQERGQLGWLWVRGA